MFNKHTHLPFVCSQYVVTWHWDWNIFSDLQAQKYRNPGLVTPYGDKILVIIGSGNGLSSTWCQSLSEPMIHIHDKLVGPLGTNFCEMLFKSKSK